MLCAACTEAFRALEFNAEATRSSNIMPFCSIVWSDEVPEMSYKFTHPECRIVVIQLMSARKSYWQTGVVPPDLLEAREQFRIQFPEWPGFHRLEISPDDRNALAGCAEELSDVMSAIAKDFPNVKISTDAPGVTSFVATRKPWWKFW